MQQYMCTNRDRNSFFFYYIAFHNYPDILKYHGLTYLVVLFYSKPLHPPHTQTNFTHSNQGHKKVRCIIDKSKLKVF